LAVAERVGYKQNAAGRTLQRGHSTVVLIALPPWPLGPPVAEAITNLCGEVSALGYAPLVLMERSTDETGLLLACHEVRPVAVIAPNVNFKPGVVADICASGARGVISYGDSAVPGTYSLIGSQGAVGARAAGYLLERGNHDVLGVMITGSPVITQMGENRSAGARQACREGGGRYRSLRARSALEPMRSALRRAIDDRLPDAVYAFNDETAFMVILALREDGCKVPEDVAVIGCDDSPAAALFQPPLTSVRADWRSLAEPLRMLATGEVVTGRGEWLDIRVVPRKSA
jgi:DNA-binding LacI/PurR family transcriptional regulator